MCGRYVCKLFGHRATKSGHRDQRGTVWGGYVDGMGHKTWHLIVECTRCGEPFTVGMFDYIPNDNEQAAVDESLLEQALEQLRKCRMDSLSMSLSDWSALQRVMYLIQARLEHRGNTNQPPQHTKEQ